MSAPVAIGRAARLLGYAGLLPPMAGVAFMLIGRNNPTDRAGIQTVAGYWLTIAYAALILSFLGGMWWAFAMRRDERQGRAATLAVVPSLAAFSLIVLAFLSSTKDVYQPRFGQR